MQQQGRSEQLDPLLLHAGLRRIGTARHWAAGSEIGVNWKRTRRQAGERHAHGSEATRVWGGEGCPGDQCGWIWGHGCPVLATCCVGWRGTGPPPPASLLPPADIITSALPASIHPSWFLLVESHQ